MRNRGKRLYATNTDSRFFLYTPTNEYYDLAAGRWFRSKDLQGHWIFASADLPEDFGKIPPSSPASGLLSSVFGAEEAKDAVLIAQIPTVMEIDPNSAAAQAKVSYSGAPQFAAIEGTSLYYATNTINKVTRLAMSTTCACRACGSCCRMPMGLGRQPALIRKRFTPSAKLAGLQRDLRDADDHLPWNSGM